MYSSGYKPGLQAQKKMQYHSKGKSCGYYMRIVFFFSSLIQSLIIVSLVLFLIYGKKQDSASTSRIQDLEESFSRLSIENVALRQQRKNLTTLLNTTLTEKARNDWDLAQLRYFSNISAVLIQDIDTRLKQCNIELFMCKSQRVSGACPPIQQPGFCNCGLMVEQMKARLALVESNFTQTSNRMRMEMDQIAKDRDNLNLEAIRLRRDKSTHEKEIQFFRQKCKDDFVLSLSGVSNVTTAFLRKVDTLFPTHIAFQLTCSKQGEHLEQIRTNCTSLSREVEDKFQRYLNSVGEQVSAIQSESSRLKAENWRLSEDYRWCSQNRTGMALQHRQNLDKLQRKHDEDKEKLLLDKMKLNGEIDVLNNNVKYKTKEVEHLAERLKHLNMSCMLKTGSNGFSGGLPSLPGTRQTGPGWGMSATGGSSSASSSSSGLGRTGSGSSFSSPFNKPVSTGAGSSSSSFPSAGSSSSSGSIFNKPTSTGTGSSSSSFPSAGSSSSSSSVFNKPISTGTGSSSSSFPSLGSSSSSGSVFNKPAPSGGAFSNFGSAGSNPSLSSSGTGLNKPVLNGRSSTFGSAASSPSLSSSGTTLNKPTSNVRSPSTFGSSSTSTGSTGKTGTGSTGFGSWLGFGNSNPGPSKPGSGTGRGTSTGTSLGGTGSSGRTSGLGGGAVSVSQHLKDLQRLINPAGPEEKQDLSRMLG